MTTEKTMERLANIYKELYQIYEDLPRGKDFYSPKTLVEQALFRLQDAMDTQKYSFPMQRCIRDADGGTHLYKGKRIDYITGSVTEEYPKAWCNDNVEIASMSSDKTAVQINWAVPNCDDCRKKYFTDLDEQMEALSQKQIALQRAMDKADV